MLFFKNKICYKARPSYIQHQAFQNKKYLYFFLWVLFDFMYRIQPAKIYADPCGSGPKKTGLKYLGLLQTCNLAFKHLYERFRVGGLKGIFLIHTRTYCMYLHRWSYDVTFDPQELETKFRRSCRLSHPQLIHPCQLDTQYTVNPQNVRLQNVRLKTSVKMTSRLKNIRFTKRPLSKCP